MAGRPSIAFYGDIPAEFGATIPRTPGVIPDALTLVIREEDKYRVPPVADVTLLDGGLRYVVPRCRAAAVDFISPGKSRLTVFDRRWRWRGGMMDLFANGAGFSGLLATSDQIARYILDTAGEPLYDLRGITGYGFPEMAAEGQKPADVLLELIERIGVEPIIDNRDAIKFIPLGFAPDLPANPRLLNRSDGYQFDAGPDLWVYRGGVTLFQRDWVMEPVGEEPSGEVKPIEDLSYRPKDGWISEDPRDFGGVDVEFRELARTCVFRWFRIKLPIELPHPKFPADTPKRIKTAIKKMLKVEDDERHRILPMGQFQVAANGDAPANIDRMPEAIIIGRHWMGGEAARHNAKPQEVDGKTREKPHIIVRVPREIEEERGLVKFAEPVYALGDDFEKIVRPKLRIRVGLGVRDPESYTFLKQDWYFKARPIPIGTLPEFIQDESIHYVIWDQYEPTKKEGLTNEREFSEAASIAIRNKLKDTRPQRPETWQYDGMQLIEPGGRVRQVKYEYGEGGLTTTVTLDDPALPDAPTIAEQQLYRGVNSWIASQRRSRKQRAKRPPAGDD